MKINVTASRAIRLERLGLVARLGLPVLCMRLLSAPAFAQDLLIIGADKTLTRVEMEPLSGAVTTIPITGMSATESIVGVKRNREGGRHEIRFLTSFEPEQGGDGTSSSYTLQITDTTATAINGCLVDNGSWGPIAWPLVEYASNINESSPLNGFTALIDYQGNLYNWGQSCNSPPSTVSLLSLAPPGGVFAGSAVYQGDLLVLRRSASQIVLSRLHYPNFSGPPVVTQTWNVTDLVGGTQFGMTLDCTGRLWADVCRPASGGCNGPHNTGDYILARSDEILASSTALTLRPYKDIGDWRVAGLGCCPSPRVYMFFEVNDLTGSACPSSRFCFGDGSGALCPCALQNGGPGRGCKNSKPGNIGCLLTTVNSVGGPNPSVSVTANDLGLKSEGMLGGSFCLFFQGTAQVNGGLGQLSPNFDGLECVGGTIVRLGRITTMGGTNTLAGVAGVAGLAAGSQTLYYQAAYRNAVAFCTPATLNTSNALQINWEP